jgi:hypothetical protein
MNKGRFAGMIFLIFSTASVTWGWQAGPVPPGTGNAPLAGYPQAQGGPASEVSPGYAAGAPTWQGNGTPPTQGLDVPGRQGYPTYPYPPYHNPYFEGRVQPSFITRTLDWLFSVHTGVMDRVADYVDGKFFPRAPATSGRPGPPNQADPGPAGSPNVVPPSVPPPEPGQVRPLNPYR